ncbi:hypothetical protein DFJ58DRAFT_366515 [Suillus subalutaceus]|uniref:uncharacterized protein n=1 Tax=Suillus subalutaceus TaxID=48586 RepID=UPI001B863E91|nr:uncharacterized protein DFJ58DRAFT_366515 [Suillus subalutaceus]KAG1873644.1 hypothetical protein DFJ58DRAFT_366515 [Suillus subalutaceus]
MSDDHKLKPASEAGSREATAGEISSQPRSGFCRALRKFKKNNIAGIVQKRFKRSRHQTPAVPNADHEGTSSNQNIGNTSPLHPSDGDKPVTSENPSGCVNQGAPGEPALKDQAASSGVEEAPDPQSVHAGLRGAREGAENMRQLGKHITSVASAAKDGPAGLADVDNFQTTYLQPLRIFNTVIKNLANVHPYAKVALGALSAASEIILAQTERDESVQSLLDKLEEVYRFMSQDDTLGQISSKHNTAGRIAQQTLECARFIRDYSKTKSFCKS